MNLSEPDAWIRPVELEDARRLALELMAEHGLEGWAFTFDRARRRAGKCAWSTRTISLSAPITRLHDDAEVQETMLHEIAHALTPGEGHSEVWRRTAIRIGSTGERVSEDAPRLPGAWVGTCAAGHSADRHRAPTRVVSCSQCSRGFSPEHLFAWTHHGRPAEMPPAYRLELQRLREGRPNVRIVVPGRYEGVVGTVAKRTTVNYVVRTRHGLLRLPHAGAVPA